MKIHEIRPSGRIKKGTEFENDLSRINAVRFHYSRKGVVIYLGVYEIALPWTDIEMLSDVLREAKANHYA